MNDTLRAVAAEWANKIISSRVDVAAGDRERRERWDQWREGQTLRLRHFARSAAEAYLRRSRPDFAPPLTEPLVPDERLIGELRLAIAREVATASAAQAAMDAAIVQEALEAATP